MCQFFIWLIVQVVDNRFLKCFLFKICQAVITDGVDGSHLLRKLLLLLGLRVLGSGRLSWSLLSRSLSSGLAAVGQTERCVGSLHGAGVNGG